MNELQRHGLCCGKVATAIAARAAEAILLLFATAITIFCVPLANAQGTEQTASQHHPPVRPTTDPTDRDYINDDAPKPEFVTSARRLLTAPELPSAPEEWIARSLAWVNFILRAYPPSVPEFPARRSALIRMDDILHIPNAPAKPIIQKFYIARMEEAIEQIEHTRVTDGIQVWKLYNHGFFVRTKSVSFTFDIVPGGGDPDFAISDSVILRLAAQSDATFISHLHPDHANKQVAIAFLAIGKPVIAPPGLWADDPDFRGRLIYPQRGTDSPETISLPAKHTALHIIAYPGHQGRSVENNVNLVITPENYTVVQTGDQFQPTHDDPDFAFFQQMGRAHHVDLLLPNIWMSGLPRVIRSVHPGLVISGHENEMGHPVAHREDYTQTYNRLFTTTTTSYLVMTWGETYHYLPTAAKR